ncbi:hypothetical protein AB4Z48_17765 [Cupriavidus sp. 2TAF22]|uniref:hypothetical protein n=1 Tax=unclassified Cupriavidus TaxID=2640874 RepID=UPI003F932E00
MSATSIKLTIAELQALAGAGADAVNVYVMGIRPRMDYRTGVVGRTVAISYQAIKEWTERLARPGVRFFAYSRDQIRRLVDQLVNLGLVRKEGGHRELVLRCLLADTDNCAQKKAAKGSPYPAGASQASQDKGKQAVGKTARTAKAAPHPESGLKASSPTPSRLRRERDGKAIDPHAPTVREDDKTQGGETQAGSEAQRLSEERHEPAKRGGKGPAAPKSEKGARSLVRWQAHLAWPVDMTGQQRAYLARRLRPLGAKLGQLVLDEWRGECATGGIRAPWRYLSWLITQAQLDGWEPVHAAEVARRRELARLNHAANEAVHAAKVASVPPLPLPRGRLATLVAPPPSKRANWSRA